MEKLEDQKRTVEFDYVDPELHSSTVKKGVLHALRIEQTLQKMGSIELTAETIAHVRQSAIRHHLYQVAEVRSEVDLTSQELPFYLRAELAHASLHHELVQHLGGLDKIEVYAPKSLREKVQRKVGAEILDELVKKQVDISPEIETQVRLDILAEQGAKWYDLAFDHSIEPVNVAAQVANYTLKQLPAAQDLTSKALTVKDFGSGMTLDQVMHLHELSQDTFGSRKDQAKSNDILRSIFQTEGEIQHTPTHGGLYLAGSSFASLWPEAQQYIANKLFENLLDAQLIQRAKLHFRDGVSEEVAGNSIFSGGALFGRSGLTTRGEDESFRFDDDPTTDLYLIAEGAQRLLKSDYSSQALALYDPQTASENRRNQGAQALRELVLWGASHTEDPEPITQNTIFEYWGINDEDQEHFLRAFKRVTSNGIYVGVSDDSRADILFEISDQGNVQAQFRERYLSDEPGESFDAIAEAQEREFFAAYDFCPNMDRLFDTLRSEIIDNERVTQQLALLSENPLFVDRGVFDRLTEMSDATKKLAELEENLTSLLPFVKSDTREYLTLLGLEKATSVPQIDKAYRRAIRDQGAHPDLGTESENSTDTLMSLQRARHELSAYVRRQQTGSQVSTYFGRPSLILHSE